MHTLIQTPDQLTPERLTAILRAGGVLARGAVTGLSAGAPRTTFAYTVWQLQVAYSPNASPEAPGALFLKVSTPELTPGEFDPAQAHKEVVFYRDVAPQMPASLTLPCYSAAIDPGSGASHILLKDLSSTHAACPAPYPVARCEQALDRLAQFHAFWWDHPQLGKSAGQFPTPAERQQEWADAERCTADFCAAAGDQLPAAWRAVYQTVLPALPTLYQRHALGRNLTLAHGDAHLGNFLFPKFNPVPKGQELETHLIDWQFWHPTLGGTDLAFMLVTEWETASRRQNEQALLRRYHTQLLRLGVHDYTWQDCWDDYRISILLVSLFIPVWRWSIFHWSVDWPALERAMLACIDLQCTDFL
jgi:thiamine kinase-like enzyme